MQYYLLFLSYGDNLQVYFNESVAEAKVYVDKTLEK